MIKGRYEIISDGKIIAESPNIITSSGLYAINSFLVNSSPTAGGWAQTMRVGASYTAATSSDVSMAYEVANAPTTLPVYQSGSIVLTANFPQFIGEIYEIGIIPDKTLDAGSQVSTFDIAYNTASSYWYTTSGSTTLYALFDKSNSRVGAFNIWAKTASAYSIANSFLKTSNWNTTGSGYLDLLYFVPKDSVGGTTPSLTFIVTDTFGNKFKTITSSINVSASGYQKAFVKLGKPDTLFDNTGSFPQLFTASFVGGTGSISLDSLYYRNTVRTGANQALLSRTSASSYLLKTTVQPQTIQIKYILQVT